MEFPFSINAIFQSKITRIKPDLLPPGFKGDVRAMWKCSSQVSDIIDAMGIASARAQGLQKAITSGDRLRSFDHTLYLLTYPEGNSGKGVVVGLLKIGRKKLFVFDADGQHHELEPLCVLDFYIHESMQRMGCGKLLYEHMLQEENVKPEQLAIDRPSEKFLAFLNKHYNLSEIIPQANNYVIFEEFFSNQTASPKDTNATEPYRRTQLVDPSKRTWFGSADDINRLSQNTPFQKYNRNSTPSSSIGIILHHSLPAEHSNGNEVATTAPFKSGENTSFGTNKTARVPSCTATVIIEPKSIKSISPAVAPLGSECDKSPMKDIKFRHTPLW